MLSSTTARKSPRTKTTKRRRLRRKLPKKAIFSPASARRDPRKKTTKNTDTDRRYKKRYAKSRGSNLLPQRADVACCLTCIGKEPQRLRLANCLSADASLMQRTNRKVTSKLPKKLLTALPTNENSISDSLFSPVSKQNLTREFSHSKLNLTATVKVCFI